MGLGGELKLLLNSQEGMKWMKLTFVTLKVLLSILKEQQNKLQSVSDTLFVTLLITTQSS